MVTRSFDLNRFLKTPRSILLFGPRGVGKSTLVQAYMSDKPHLFYNLLETDTFTRLVRRPDRLRAEIQFAMRDHGDSPFCVVIDEIQKIPALLDEIHALIERYKSALYFVLTGSSVRKLRRSWSNLLAGRAWQVYLHPFTHDEWGMDLGHVLQFGSIPSVVADMGHADRTLAAYVGTYLREEIQQETQIRNLGGFTRFLEVAAQVHGEPVNFTKIGREVGVSTKTVQSYFEILIDTLIAFQLPAWHPSVRKQVQQSPKFYFFDCGVLNALRGDLQSTLQPSSYRYGKLFETLFLLACFRLNDYRETGYRFYYWRTSTGQEVDLIVHRGSTRPPLALEIKSSVSPDKESVKGLRAFFVDNPNCERWVVGQNAIPYMIDDIPVFPWQDALRSIF
jgi:predicted AAA+ superfamily ATPase